MENKLIIRDARAEEASFVAWTIAEALGTDQSNGFLAAARREDTIYSWKFARVAELDGVVVGCQVACTGDDYVRLRGRSWMTVWEGLTESYVESLPLESEADEYHLDSIAILPQYRGLHFSKDLIMDAVHIGEALGYKRASFAVDASHSALHEYYKTMGFRDEKSMRLGYTDFIKMYYIIKNEAAGDF